MDEQRQELSQNTDSLLSPDWHKKVLEQREKDFKNGKESFVEWSFAKKRIRDTISRKNKH